MPSRSRAEGAASVRPVAAEIVATAAGPAQFPAGDLPEMAFAGRSNVGKSSLLNRLAGRKNLARTSGEPGKTRLLNFFRVTYAVDVQGESSRRDVVLVDLPGYGYARVPKEERERWRGLVESYLERRPALRTAIVLQDLRRELSDAERELFAWLSARGIPALLVLTKVDKLAPMRRAARVRALVEASELPREQVLPTSAATGEGVDALLSTLLSRT